MNVMDAIAGAVLMAMLGGAVWLSHNLGEAAGRWEVINACANYGKYHSHYSADEMTCSGMFNPQDLAPSVAESTAKLYSKENKDLHKKDRK